MAEPVHIHLSCRSNEMAPAATLVFKTLRTGFPDAPVYLWPQICLHAEKQIRAAAEPTGSQWARPPRAMNHGSLIEYLIESRHEPFWICDTDVVFWKRFEHEPADSGLAGVRTPSFYEPWSRSQYRERLHTCLMRIDPERFRQQATAFIKERDIYPWLPKMDFISQQWQAERSNGTLTRHFYDTLAMAWHAFGGQEFTQEQIESFDHLNCATYADRIAPSLDFDILGAHKAIYKDHRLARGSWAKQFEWFAEHKVQA